MSDATGSPIKSHIRNAPAIPRAVSKENRSAGGSHFTREVQTSLPMRRVTFLILKPFLFCLTLAGCLNDSNSVRPGVSHSQTGAASSSQVEFADVTASYGVHFSYENGEEAGQNAILESLGGGVGIFDYDLDDRLDLFLPGGGGFGPKPSVVGRSSVLFRQVTGEHFEDRSESAGILIAKQYSHGVAIGDSDNDGFPDVLVTGYGSVTLWRNQGDGTFADATAESGLSDRMWSSSAAWGDIDGDGALDLYLAHYATWSFENHPRCNGAQPGVVDVCPPRRFDGLDDSLFLGNGDGTFRDGSRDAGLKPRGKGLGVILIDIDQDQDLDVYVANDTDDNFLYLNDGHGRLSEVGMISGTAVDDKASPNGSMGVSALDYNGDGLPDLWVANYEDETFALYQNMGEAQFTHSSTRAGIGAIGTLFVGFGTVCGDFDADGDEDIAVANGHVIHHPINAPVRQEPLLLTNEQKKQFSRVSFPANSYFSTPHKGRGLAQGDLDNDGDLDLVFANSNEPAAIQQNKTPTSGKWLKIRLVGTASPRDGTGARIILRTSKSELLRHAFGGGSYLSASDRAVHFGYGSDETPESVTVYWPSGQRSELPLASTIPSPMNLLVIEK